MTMNPIDERMPCGDDHRFDLLVDGELGEAERRELLGGLDDQPGGWRRCALAFLEAQTWTRDFGSMLRAPAGQRVAKRPARRPWLGPYRGTLVAMAASFLVALFLGPMLRDVWQPPGPAGSAPTELAADPGHVPVADRVASHKEQPLKQPDGPESEPPEAFPYADTPSSLWRMVEFAPSGGLGSDAESFQLPAVERENLDGDWLQSLPVTMSDEVLQRFKQFGYRVRQRRALLPFRMKDGRRLVVPVDNYDVHYVGNPPL